MKAIKTFFQIFNFISPQPDHINESDEEWEEMGASNEATRNCVNRLYQPSAKLNSAILSKSTDPQK